MFRAVDDTLSPLSYDGNLGHGYRLVIAAAVNSAIGSLAFLGAYFEKANGVEPSRKV
jgi:hypothetical protein